MVEVQYYGRLGNNLFQYAIGRIIAEELGFELRCVPAKDPLGESAHLSVMAKHFADCRLVIPGERYTDPREEYSVFEPTPFGGYVIDLDKILSDREGRHIILGGMFQQIDYFTPYEDRIRSWFLMQPSERHNEIGQSDIVISIRRGDALKLGWSLDLNYYENILASTDFTRLFICGDSINGQVKRFFRKYSPTYYLESAIKQFRFIRGFNKIVQSQSTFSWWAAYLSDATEIYTPRPLQGPWRKDNPNIDLEVHDDRYIYIDDVPTIPIPTSIRMRTYLKKRRCWPFSS